MVGSIGPHIFVNPGRPPAIEALELVFFNRLPFPVTIEGMKFEIGLESTGLTEGFQGEKVTIPQTDIGRLTIKKHSLSDSQAEMVRKYPNEKNLCNCPTLRIQLDVQVKTTVGEFQKTLTIETRAFVFRGME